MKRNVVYFVLLALITVTACTFTQEQPTQTADGKTGIIAAGQFNLEYEVISEEMNDIQHCEPPIFPGGTDSLAQYIKNKLKYPKTAVLDSVQGKVRIEFVVNKDGQVGNIRLIQGLRQDIDSVSLNVLKSMPRWSPAYSKENGKNYDVKLILPLKFSLK